MACAKLGLDTDAANRERFNVGAAVVAALVVFPDRREKHP